MFKKEQKKIRIHLHYKHSNYRKAQINGSYSPLLKGFRPDNVEENTNYGYLNC